MAIDTHSYLPVTDTLRLYTDDIEMEAVRSSGAGGQNVNKVSTAIHLRFDIRNARLPEDVRARLLASRDRRINSDGTLVIKAQRFRTQAQNRDDAIARLLEVLGAAAVAPKARRATRPSRGARERRLKTKNINSKNKALRQKPKVEY